MQKVYERIIPWNNAPFYSGLSNSVEIAQEKDVFKAEVGLLTLKFFA